MPGFYRKGPAGLGSGAQWRQDRGFGFGVRCGRRNRGGFLRGRADNFCRRIGGLGRVMGLGRSANLQQGRGANYR